MIEKEFSEQVDEGSRFEFGKNWTSFLKNLTDQRIKVAVDSLKEMLEIDTLEGKTFLDIGSGSGLFSLAAFQLGAKVHSLDFDIQSVNCTKELRNRYGNTDMWFIEEASALDTEHLSLLPNSDIVYSWGVLHHTGNMKLALENAAITVKPLGQLFIAIYNDEDRVSKYWLKVKKRYNSGPLGKLMVKSYYFTYWSLKYFFKDLILGRNPFNFYRDYKKNRGMSVHHDWIDWLGGLPFEVASPEWILDFYKAKGFKLNKIRTTNSMGCNQFVFEKVNKD